MIYYSEMHLHKNTTLASQAEAKMLPIIIH